MALNYLLDTSICVEYLRGRSPELHRRLTAPDCTDVAVCSVVRYELVFGAERAPNPARALAPVEQFLKQFPSLPFDDTAADAAARVRALLTAAGAIIGPNDLLIAGIALAGGLTLVTGNRGEFVRVPGLRVEDWRAA